ncbi:MAG: hypothetical protein GWN07_39225, partial [Actinobacteria bacterium]|nr:hypothetical protein [Actinomycetota bacterium]NIS37002.1 hypothetical protein [Actinomycetota bacterium]NIU71466.1 hypothetical protein [Actinomycetota bacterium]NIV59220.1 hypothetical protein [Actinomycetota bacterium]NIV90841.1 hypothetical protein [Actinomycetota bacterium]
MTASRLASPYLSLALAVLSLALGCGDDGGTDPDGAVLCTDDSMCDDGIFCNGAELCRPDAPGGSPTGCVAGTAVCASGERCEEASETCLPSCEVETDSDRDGADAIACGGDDCDDGDPNRYPGNPETCDLAGRDEDCDPTTLGPDIDTDGYVSTQCCNTQTDGSLLCGDDCNDATSGVNPGQVEACNRIDDNCNGSVDEDVQQRFYPDCDGDDFGAPGSTPMLACAAPVGDPEGCDTAGAGWADANTDCDDTDPTINPGATEICDGVD